MATRPLTGDVADLEAKVFGGERLSGEELARLYRSPDILAIGRMATMVRERKSGNRTYFILNAHINPTNLCLNQCRFCAFQRQPGQEGAYEMDLDEIRRRAAELQDRPITEVHIVGGLHPDWPYERYLDILRVVRQELPRVHLQAYTAVEVEYIARQGGVTIERALQDMIDAGLGSLPGGGAEVFTARVRTQLCPNKLSPEGWLKVQRIAHGLGLRSNATMLYGHVETIEERVDHLLRLRELQDETGGFLAFIPLAYHPHNTDLGGHRTSGYEDLKTLAVARIALDNFDHIKAFWIMLGLKVAQVSQAFGVDDIDGTVMEERITHAAGAETPEALTREELVALIHEAGRDAVERGTLYNVVREEAAAR
jgi:aminodeoxyfutalosine synthase